MPLKVRENYVNPLTMMDSKKNQLLGKDFTTRSQDATKKVEELQSKRQQLQNNIILVKVTSSNGEVPEESQKVMDKALEEVTDQLKTAKSQAANNVDLDTTKLDNLKASSRFDTYVKGQDTLSEETPGLYSITQDEDGKRSILFKPDEDKT